VCVCNDVYAYICICIYVCIYRCLPYFEGGAQLCFGEYSMCACVMMYIHTYVYVYMYVYTDACHILKEGLNFALVSIQCVRV